MGKGLQSRPQPDAQPKFADDDPETKGHFDYETYRYSETAIEDLNMQGQWNVKVPLVLCY